MNNAPPARDGPVPRILHVSDTFLMRGRRRTSPNRRATIERSPSAPTIIGALQDSRRPSRPVVFTITLCVARGLSDTTRSTALTRS